MFYHKRQSVVFQFVSFLILIPIFFGQTLTVFAQLDTLSRAETSPISQNNSLENSDLKIPQVNEIKDSVLQSIELNDTTVAKGQESEVSVNRFTKDDTPGISSDEINKIQKHLDSIGLVGEIIPTEKNKSVLIRGGVATPPSAARVAGGDSAPTLPQTQQAITPHVDLSTGAGVYSYDVVVPEGRNTLTPNIAITYNNQLQNNDLIFGYGWDISIPYIERQNIHGTNVLYTSNDFSSSEYGELVNTSTNVYMPKTQKTDFVSLVYINSSWVVTNKNGLIYTYGLTTQSRQDNPNNTAETFKWMLEKVEDQNGNFISFNYFKDQGQIYPQTITYTNTASGSGIYTISFGRRNRIDIFDSYKTGFKVTTNFLINKIDVLTNGVVYKTYGFYYTTGNNSKRSLLQSIYDLGVDPSTGSSGLALPPTTFTYTNQTSPIFDTMQSQTVSNLIPDDVSNGVLTGDVNGDAYPDIVRAYEWNYYYYAADKQTFLYNPQTNTFQPNTAYQPPNNIMIFSDGAYSKFDGGTRMLDINGDLKNDLIRTPFMYNTSAVPDVELNNGSGWTQQANTVNSFYPQYTQNPWYSIFSQDINNDGLIDYLQDTNMYWSGSANMYTTSTSLNTGSSFTPISTSNHAGTGTQAYAYTPTFTGGDLHFMFDINGDNLPDIIEAAGIWPCSGQPTFTQKVYINTGKDWQLDTTYTLPTSFEYVHGGCYGNAHVQFEIIDLNHDGLNDIFIPNGAVYINQGKSFLSLSNISNTFYNILGNAINNGPQNPYLLMDVDADGDQDIIMNYYFGSGSSSTNIFYNTNTTSNDRLSSITTSSGGTYAFGYKTSAQYKDQTGVLLNPNLPLIVDTIHTITSNDQNGNIETTTYTYADGSYYYAGPFDRKFAGFGTVTESTPTKTVKTYYHQGNSTNTAMGEFNDIKAKIGKSYRTETISPSGILQSREITKWDSSTIAPTVNMIYPTDVLSQLFNTGGSSKDIATHITYDAIGNVTQEKDYGEVVGSSSGTFIDTGSDIYTKDYMYATNTANTIYAPSKITITNQSGNKEQEVQYLYDGLALGSLLKGNNTQIKNWISGANYATTQNAYNAYGLKSSITDPNGNITSYVYDTYNLYPTSITEPLSLITNYTYDYTSGKPTTIRDKNGKTTTYTYDRLDRILTENLPDPTSGTTNLTTSYTYTDIINNFSVKTSKYLDATNSVDSYTYYDGFNRPVQISTEAESGFNTSHTVYNSNGTVLKQSFPYNTTSSVKITPTSNGNLYTNYVYDALGRIISETNTVGVTSHVYSDFSDTITDPLSKKKTYTKDAQGNLVSVTEYLSSVPYTTTYTYNSLQNLTKITDAFGNVRNFMYDGRGLRISAEDLHSPTDTVFGIYNYTYDLNGNLTKKITPNGKTINYTYTVLDQKLTEDDISTTGTDIVYTYNTCANGKGRLCSTTKNSSSINYTYNSRGGIASENRVDGSTFTTSYTYDRQGNILSITYPDGTKILYTYGTNGLVDKINRIIGLITASPIVSNIDYNPINKPTTISRANGIVTTYTYNPNTLYRLTNISSQKGTDPKVQDISYTYDAVGNILSTTDSTTTSGKTATYVYDDLYRLTSLNLATTTPGILPYTENYAYDILGNISSKNSATYVYSGAGYTNPHAATTIGTTTLAYDNNGNLLSDGVQGYTWNAWDEITKIIQGTNTYTYTYDHTGQRIKEVSPTGTKNTPNKYYTKDGTLLTKYIYLGDILIHTLEGATAKYPLTDHLGSIEKVTDTVGTIIETTTYAPFGQEKTHTGTNTQRRYIGERYDISTGLNYLNARYYNSNTGRFISQDPVFWTTEKQKEQLLDPQLWNSYAYSRNNPILYKDQEGKFANLALTVASGVLFTPQPAGETVDTQGNVTNTPALTPTQLYGGMVLSELGGAVVGKGLGYISNKVSGVIGGLLKKEGGEVVKLTKNEINETASNIVEHAYDKHIVKGNEFGNIIKTESQLLGYVKGVLTNPSEVKNLERGRQAFWDSRLGGVIIRNTRDLSKSTVINTSRSVGKELFNKLK